MSSWDAMEPFRPWRRRCFRLALSSSYAYSKAVWGASFKKKEKTFLPLPFSLTMVKGAQVQDEPLLGPKSISMIPFDRF